MSFERLRCPRHPSELLVGICASCLRERLLALEPSNAEGQLLSCSSTSFKHSPTCVPINDERVEEGDIHGAGFYFRKRVFDEVNRTRFCAVSEDGICAVSEDGSHGNILMFEGSSSMANLSEIASLDARQIDEHVRPRRKTLWSLFSLDDAERSKAKNKIYEDIDLKRLNEVAVVNWLTQDSSDVTKVSEVKPNVKHTLDSNYQFPAAGGKESCMHKAADGSRTSPSWLISLLRRRMRAGSKQDGGKTICLVGKADAWEEARSSWDEAKLSSWERARKSSSFFSEGARPSLESTRPSWDDANSNSNLLAPCLEAVSERGAVSERAAGKGREEKLVRKGAVRSSGAPAAISYSLIVPEDPNQKEMVVNIAARSSVCSYQRDAGTQTTPAENEKSRDDDEGGGRSKLGWSSKSLVTPSPSSSSSSSRQKQRRRGGGGNSGGWLNFYLTPLRSGTSTQQQQHR